MQKLLIVLLMAFAASACATPEPQTPISDLSINELADRLGLANASFGYHAVDVSTGTVVASRIPDTPQPPASTAKVPTMIAALGILGRQHRFETSVLTNGVTADGILQGDLVLRGTGDPMLRTNDLRQLAAQIRSRGITAITGRFFFESTLPEFAFVEGNQPRIAPYNQGVSGLNLDFNRARLTSLSDNAYYLTPDEATGLTPVVPDVDPNMVTDVPVYEPAMLAARMFRKFADYEGIALPAPAPGATDDEFRVIASVKSLPLSEIARAGLEYSNNMVSEVVGLAASTKLGGTPPSLKVSAERLTTWLNNNLMGAQRFAPKLLNHSGLSADSRITPRQMTTLLKAALNTPHSGRRFDTYLPPGGGREGYRERFRAPTTAFRLWGKTGSMRFIKGLAGYIDTSAGRRLAFSMFTNDLDLRQKHIRSTKINEPSVTEIARDWRARAEAFESEIIRRWISMH